jgi:hypothetical protein
MAQKKSDALSLSTGATKDSLGQGNNFKLDEKRAGACLAAIQASSVLSQDQCCVLGNEVLKNAAGCSVVCRLVVIR